MTLYASSERITATGLTVAMKNEAGGSSGPGGPSEFRVRVDDGVTGLAQTLVRGRRPFFRVMLFLGFRPVTK